MAHALGTPVPVRAARGTARTAWAGSRRQRCAC